MSGNNELCCAKVGGNFVNIEEQAENAIFTPDDDVSIEKLDDEKPTATATESYCRETHRIIQDYKTI